jgi:hypothetical protein
MLLLLIKADAGNYVAIIVPAVLKNSATPKKEISPQKRASIQDQLITDVELKATAFHCLTALFGFASLPSLRTLLLHFYAALDHGNHWADPSHILALFRLAVDAVKTEYRYIIANTLFERLASSNDTQLKTTLVNIITALIAADHSLMGLTIPELLDTFCSNIFKMCSIKSDDSLATSAFNESLTTAIGNYFSLTLGTLTLNLNYSDQANDILAFLIARLDLAASDLPLDAERYFVSILKALSQTLKSSKMSAGLPLVGGDDIHVDSRLSVVLPNVAGSEIVMNLEPRQSIVLPNVVGSEIIMPLITLLNDPSEGGFYFESRY